MAHLFSLRAEESSTRLHLRLGPLVGKPARRARASSARGLGSVLDQFGPACDAEDEPPLIRVLLADSRPMVLRGLTELINAHKPLMEVVAAASGYARMLALSELLRPEVILFSFFRDAIDGLDALSSLIQRCNARVLLLKNQDDSAPIGRAMELGAHGVVLAEDPSESIGEAIVQACHGSYEGGTPWLGGLVRLSTRSPSRMLQHDAEQAKAARLTAREQELILAIVQNPSAKYLTIGAQLGISEHTVHNHLTSIYHKLSLVNRIELLVYALQHLVGDPADRAPSE